MSERFGFDLDMSAVRLVSWREGRWLEIAVEKIDGADIEERLKSMISRIDPAVPVELFLPHDQILYSDISISGIPTRDQIAAGLEGMTPYALEDLAFDFEILGPGKARVAVIAQDTLDEALAFAEARNLKVAGYSSLADPADFPRNPDFGTLEHTFEEQADEFAPVGEEPVPFVSNRPASKPPAPAIDPTGSEPVLLINDDTPVMQVETKAPPLDPGMPINAVPPKPRVTTDISASTQSGQVADSLTPGAEPSLKIRRNGPGGLRTILIFAAAAILTIGIAVVVWSILPLAPEEAGVAETGQIDLAEAAEDPAHLLPDLPVPVVWTDIAEQALTSDPILQPTAPSQRFAPDRLALVSLDPGVADSLPSFEKTTPFPPTPEHLTAIDTTGPIDAVAPDASDPVPLDAIYIASIEAPDHAYDPFALPSVTGLEDALPVFEEAPLPWDQQPAARLLAIAQPPEPITEPLTTDPDEPEPVEPLAESLPEPETDPASDEPPLTLLPTELAAALPDETPRPRPQNFVEKIERSKYGGKSLAELARERPNARPPSEQMLALQERAGTNASELAVAKSITPKNRPENFSTIVASTIAQQEAARVTAALDVRTPNTNAAVEAALSQDSEPEPRPQDSPRLAIPSNTSVARQATVENAIKLNRVNLVGVYGVPSDRRALVRLKSGRYVKVKVGDKVDGGVVAQITDTQLHYKKGSRLLTLSLPQG